MNARNILDDLDDIKIGLLALISAADCRDTDNTKEVMWIGDRLLRDVNSLVGEIKTAQDSASA